MDEDFARRYWPDAGAARSARRVFQGTDSDEAKLFTIVGIVGAVKQAELTEAPRPGRGIFSVPLSGLGNIFVRSTRTSQRPEAFAATLRKLVRTIDPELAVANVRSMETRDR